MRMILSILTICLLATQHSKADPACDDSTGTSTFQLCQDFRDIRNLIDPNTLVYYISNGYFQDADFRKAMDYIRSDSFASISDQIAKSAPYKALLKQLSDAGVNTESVASISNIFKCVMISKPKYGELDDYDGDYGDLDSLEMQSIIAPRTVQEIATNLQGALSSDKVRELIQDKVADGGQFAKFYKVVRTSKFRKGVNKLWTSTQLTYPLSVLKRNKIDLKKLTKLARKVLDYGK